MELLDHPLIGQRYFFPRACPMPNAVHVPVEGATLGCVDARIEGAPTLLHFHGNGEVAADWQDTLIPAMAERGVGVVLAEYRGYGASTGSPAMATMLDDALAVHQYFADERKLVVYGRSVGSLYALHVAGHRQVAGLVIESGVADVAERIRLRVTAEELGVTDAELDDAFAQHFDHRAKMTQAACPVRIFHAENDHLVSVGHAKKLAAWAKADAGRDAELTLFSMGDHNTVFAYNGEAILDALAKFALPRV